VSERQSYTPEQRYEYGRYASEHTPQAAVDKFRIPIGSAKSLKHRYEQQLRKLQAITVNADDEQLDADALAKLAPDALPLSKWLKLRSVSERRWLAEGERGSAFAAKAAASCLKIAEDAIAALREVDTTSDAARAAALADAEVRAERAIAAAEAKAERLADHEVMQLEVLQEANAELRAENERLRLAVSMGGSLPALPAAKPEPTLAEQIAEHEREPIKVNDRRAVASDDSEIVDAEIVEEARRVAHNPRIDVTGLDARGVDGRPVRILPGSVQATIGGIK
jgi:hypothetical protein